MSEYNSHVYEWARSDYRSCDERYAKWEWRQQVKATKWENKYNLPHDGDLDQRAERILLAQGKEWSREIKASGFKRRA